MHTNTRNSQRHNEQQTPLFSRQHTPHHATTSRQHTPSDMDDHYDSRQPRTTSISTTEHQTTNDTPKGTYTLIKPSNSHHTSRGSTQRTTRGQPSPHYQRQAPLDVQSQMTNTTTHQTALSDTRTSTHNPPDSTKRHTNDDAHNSSKRTTHDSITR